MREQARHRVRGDAGFLDMSLVGPPAAGGEQHEQHRYRGDRGTEEDRSERLQRGRLWRIGPVHLAPSVFPPTFGPGSAFGPRTGLTHASPPEEARKSTRLNSRN